MRRPEIAEINSAWDYIYIVFIGTSEKCINCFPFETTPKFQAAVLWPLKTTAPYIDPFP